jgi:hypothetical protein
MRFHLVSESDDTAYVRFNKSHKDPAKAVKIPVDSDTKNTISKYKKAKRIFDKFDSKKRKTDPEAQKSRLRRLSKVHSSKIDNFRSMQDKIGVQAKNQSAKLRKSNNDSEHRKFNKKSSLLHDPNKTYTVKLKSEIKNKKKPKLP